MTVTIFRDMRPGMQFLFTGFVVVVVFLITQFIGALLAIPLFGFEKVAGMVTGIDFSDPESMNLLKYLQVFQSIGLFIIPSMVVAWLFHESWVSYLYLDKRPVWPAVLLVTAMIFIVNPFINFTGAINAEMHFPEWLSGLENWMRNAEDTAEKLTRSFLEVETAGGLMFNLFMIAVLPALGEELLFRGIIQRLFGRMTRSHHWGIWLSAALFSALHMQFYGFIPRILLGGMFGYLLVWSGTLWLPVLAHFVNNASAVTFLYLIDKGKVSPRIEEFGAGMEEWYIAAFSLALGLITLLAIRNLYRPTSPTASPPHLDY
jgi:uncharacterized protein